MPTSSRAHRLLAAFLLLSLCFVSFGCRKSESIPADVIARAGDRFLTLGDFKRYLIRNTGTELAQIAPSATSPLLDQFIEEIVLAEYAGQHGFDAPAAKVAAAVRSDPSSTVVEKRDELRRTALIGEITSKVSSPTEQEIRAWFDQHREEFKTGEQVHVKQILVRDQKVADEIVDQLRHGVSFEELSRKYSSAPNAERGGEIGYVGRGQLPKVFEDEIFRLRPGLTSGVIETDSSFHIFKVDDFQPPGEIDVRNAAPLIGAKLRSDAASEQVKELLNTAKAQFPIVIYSKRLPFDYTGTLLRNREL
ncbi:MAG TPA: peptidylprolyl isomerase [Thermoanaerobaculia bacterium]|nr:peptidylprolyl isomerase [Thermoanaerobaculia bacterium]